MRAGGHDFCGPPYILVRDSTRISTAKSINRQVVGRVFHNHRVSKGVSVTIKMLRVAIRPSFCRTKKKNKKNRPICVLMSENCIDEIPGYSFRPPKRRFADFFFCSDWKNGPFWDAQQTSLDGYENTLSNLMVMKNATRNWSSVNALWPSIWPVDLPVKCVFIESTSVPVEDTGLEKVRLKIFFYTTKESQPKGCNKVHLLNKVTSFFPALPVKLKDCHKR